MDSFVIFTKIGIKMYGRVLHGHLWVPIWVLNEVLTTKFGAYTTFLAYTSLMGKLPSRVKLFSLILQLSEEHIQMPESCPPYLR